MKKALSLLFGLTLCSFTMAQSLGELTFTPTRLMLDDKTKTATMTLLNRGTKPVYYRLSLVDMEMNESGALVRLSGASKNSAKEYLRFSPREIALAPGAWQKIKILSTVPASASAGEYRSHLAFEPIQPREAAAKGSDGSPSGLRIELKMQAAMTIPVFVRHGSVNASGEIKSAELIQADGAWKVSCEIERHGNRTLRGDYQVLFKPQGSQKASVVGKLLDLPLYFPNRSRTVLIPFERDLSKLGAGSYTVEFSEPGGKPVQAPVKMLAASRG